MLSGLQVLDLADGMASFCSRLLADLGAEVVKVEKPGGDASRLAGPFLNNIPHAERSLSFWNNNTNKLGITLNLDSEQGRDIFLRLADKSDVVIETFSPGYLEKLGLGYKVLSERNPELILASITGFGQTGPYDLYKSCDIVASAMGGQMYVCGMPDTSPLKPHGQQSYYSASLFATIGILIALHERNHSARGQHIDISLQEAVAATLEHVMVRYFYDNVIPERQGSLHWNSLACVFPCKDGYILLTFNREWDTLVELLNSEGMADDLVEEKWRDDDYRSQHVQHVIEVLTCWTKAHTSDELFKLGQLMHFPWAPICSPQEVFNSPQLAARDYFVSVDHLDTGDFFTYPGVPWKLSEQSAKVYRRAPFVGEHNVEVYSGRLGLSSEELDRLYSDNVI